MVKETVSHKSDLCVPCLYVFASITSGVISRVFMNNIVNRLLLRLLGNMSGDKIVTAAGFIAGKFPERVNGFARHRNHRLPNLKGKDQIVLTTSIFQNSVRNAHRLNSSTLRHRKNELVIITGVPSNILHHGGVKLLTSRRVLNTRPFSRTLRLTGVTFSLVNCMFHCVILWE